MTLRVVSWNINSVRLRLALLQRVVDKLEPDILCLQEVKCPMDSFPHKEIEAMGFPYRAVKAAKSKGGVATLSIHPITQSFCLDLDGVTDDCRHLATTILDMEIHNFYVPAGGYVPDPEKNDKFAYKLRFLEGMADWFKEKRTLDAPHMLVCGDLNVAPEPNDVWSHEKMTNVVSHTEEEVSRLNHVRQAVGFDDVMRSHTPADQKLYSWWTYRQPDWRSANRGRRLDHIWLSSSILARYQAFDILTEARGWERPSDHVPIRVHLTDNF